MRRGRTRHSGFEVPVCGSICACLHPCFLRQCPAGERVWCASLHSPRRLCTCACSWAAIHTLRHYLAQATCYACWGVCPGVPRHSCCAQLFQQEIEKQQGKEKLFKTMAGLWQAGMAVVSFASGQIPNIQSIVSGFSVSQCRLACGQAALPGRGWIRLRF